MPRKPPPAVGEILDTLDWSAPGATDGASRSWSLRTRIPFQLDASSGMAVRQVEPEAPEVHPEAGHAGPIVVEGVASSTSADWYGTEMSLEALQGMAEQMQRGVDYVPNHGDSEWDKTLGKTVSAEVVRSEVERPSDPTETQFLLRTKAELDPDNPLSVELLRRAAKGQRIGQSIGGWFTRIKIVEVTSTDADGQEIEDYRIIILGVELDHLALTRSPANPDSWVESLRATVEPALRSRLQERMQTRAKAAEVAPAPVVVAETRGATRYADLPLADAEEAWDWSAETSDEVLGDPPDWDRYRRAHFWYDPDNREAKAGYKLPFARMFGDTLRAVPRGVHAAMGALNGARGGVDIPDEDREPVYNHVRRYYEKLGEEPPELASTPAPDTRDAPPDVSPAAVPLDTPADTGQDQANDAHRGAPIPEAGTQPAEHEEGTEMDQETQDLLRSLKDQVERLTGEVTSLREAGKPAPEDPKAAMERQIASMQATIDRLVNEPARRGVRPVAMVAAELDDHEKLAARCKADGYPALASFFNKAERAKLLLEEDAPTDNDVREHALDNVRAFLRAAEMDGLLHPWGEGPMPWSA